MSWIKSNWLKLQECNKSFFYAGILLKFKTLDTGGNNYKYALLVGIDGSRQLSCVGLQGESWGYGRSELPSASNYRDNPYTLSVQWLLDNFNYICRPEDMSDVWYCEFFDPVPREWKEQPKI